VSAAAIALLSRLNKKIITAETQRTLRIFCISFAGEGPAKENNNIILAKLRPKAWAFFWPFASHEWPKRNISLRPLCLCGENKDFTYVF
jgi:hypothetical protein